MQDTEWQRDGANASDEQSPPAKQQHRIQTLPKGSVVEDSGGQQFAVKMAAVIGLRVMARGDDFQLSTNPAGFGNFYDLVYTTNTKQYFLHLKHTDNPDATKLVLPDLVSILHKCFASYVSIMQEQEPTFNNIPLERSEFIIYTNKQLEPKLLQHNRQQSVTDVVFKTHNTGETFNFTPDDNKEIDVYTLVETLVKESKEFGDLSLTQQEDKVKMIKKFLEKLTMATSPNGENKLDNVITEEIMKHDAVEVSPKMYETELLYFKKLLETSVRNKRRKVTAETIRNCLQLAKTRTCVSIVRDFSDSSRKIYYGTGTDFSDSEISRLQAELSDKRAVHLRSDALTLCSILLMDCLHTSKCIFVTLELLQSNKNMLLHAWLGGHWEWLAVLCDSTVQQSDISDKFHKITEIVQRDPSGKRVIILTSCSVHHISGFVPIEHKFKFEQLSDESQEIVLDKKIDFQGCQMKIRSLLQRHGNVEHVLEHELVTDLITEKTPVKIGGTLQMNECGHATKPLKREIYLTLHVLQNSDSYPDIFAVSGMEKKNLVEIVPSYEIVGKFCFDEDPKTGERIDSYNEFKMSRFILLKSNNLELCFRRLCEKHKGKTIHWLKFEKESLLWQESRGGIASLINYVDPERTRGDKRIITEFMKRENCGMKEDSILSLGEKVVLVVAEPGVVQSITTTQVAWHTKECDPTSWVVRINWNDHTKKLQEIDAATFNFDSLVEFLCSAAFPESKYTGINRNLLKYALQNSGNITVLMDGYDEISPIHADKAAVILSQLMKTKVSTIRITSSPAEKERLEKELCVTAFTPNELSQESLHSPSMSRSIPSTFSVTQQSPSLENESGSKQTFTGSLVSITKPTTASEHNLEINRKLENLFRPNLTDASLNICFSTPNTA